MTGTDDEKYSLRDILDGTKYQSREVGPTYSEGEDYSSQPKFGTQNPLPQHPTNMEEISSAERET